MKALIVLAAVAGTAFVGYSYTSTDGQSCAVCPLTGEPLMTSVEADAPCCSACATEEDLLLTSVDGEEKACCSEGACTMCEACSAEAGEALLTSVDGEQCEACASEAGCTKGCCSEKEEMTSEDGDSDAAESVPAVEVIE